ncbi:GDP-mannose-dependent alpha-(1-6)-phosphatidylinositol monomannoside mannosyltransferase [Roseivivax jejudonensis]|uniref:GDP-mannose-dependent alpha-(1-6)-phosphatidylinositol monomannoside mannosyltransferase n=1 Tax=Roseivivax jejudonensis TaxID=1529041 RepID=A0A1X7A0C6_9RHOB|nr:glycosyltransferase [Roseivivax jejudonensis]SLN65002.1 GDP-mannose-dependent alpha-(1-6)-phosphatidylinositol monomannoside mannosyltransferase [Roseivivax jejudonensis]
MTAQGPDIPCRGTGRAWPASLWPALALPLGRSAAQQRPIRAARPDRDRDGDRTAIRDRLGAVGGAALRALRERREASFSVALLRLYLRVPSRIGHHSRKARGLLAREGLAGVAALVGQHLSRHRFQRAAARRLADYAAAEAQNLPAVRAWTAALPGGPAELNAADTMEGVLRHLYTAHGLFDAEHYRDTVLPDADDDACLDHFLTRGRFEGANPNPYFDFLGYLFRYPDVAAGGIDPCLHYAFFGWTEGRVSGSAFDGPDYLRRNADVAEAAIPPFVHFMTAGRAEGRHPAPAARPAPGPVAAPEPGDAPAASKGTIVLVSHDAGVGGAQKLVQSMARWITDRTLYDVRIVCMEGGGLLHEFEAIAPTFVLSGAPEETAEAALDAFCGGAVRGLVMNSIASLGVLAHWGRDTPTIAYIHELPRVLASHPAAVALLRGRVDTVIAGSDAVAEALRGDCAVPSERITVQHAFVTAAPEGGPDARRAARDRLGLPQDAHIVAGCGMLHWRKSPEVFVEVAAEVLSRAPGPVQFVWVGGGPDQEACEALVRDRGIADHVTFTGYCPDVQDHLTAADVFLLTSVEDAFPLVCLMAAGAGTPVLCFDEAGGAPELVAQGCGSAVPFMDVAAMAHATLDYIGDADRRHREGAAGIDIVRRRYTAETACPHLFSRIRTTMGAAPGVSIVVPNYNCGAFLAERLASIEAQSLQDFELLLLDDASTDGSAALLHDLAARRPDARVVVNAENTGSPFAQWIRGMEMARSPLVWIAEADDTCAPEFLRTLLPRMEDRNVFLAHARSVPVDADGAPLGDYAALYLDRIAPDRWAASYTATDREEVISGLGIANCIPNASAVILRRFEIEPAFREAVTGMRICGDWLFYLRALRGGLLAYAHAPLNFHRRHGGTVTAEVEGSPRYFAEMARTRAFIEETWPLPEAVRARAEAFHRADADRFGVARLPAPPVPAAARAERLPAMLFVTPDLSPGGGQLFTIRLANAWASRGGRAVLYNVGHVADHADVVARIDPTVALFGPEDVGRAPLESLCHRFGIEVVHSSIWWADRFVEAQIGALPDLGWLVTMHGCHATLDRDPAIDTDFAAAFARMRGRVDRWVCVADANRRIFDAHGAPEGPVGRIVNGVSDHVAAPRSRADLGLRDDAVVFCLASRAIPEKGWALAADMTARLNAAGLAADLLLVGSGPEADRLAAEARPHVHLCGHVRDAMPYLAACDIALLPSTFSGESLPLAVIEAMALGKPVVATDIGDIAWMVGTGQGAAGCVVPIPADGDVATGFVAACTDLAGDAHLRADLGRAARARYRRWFTETEMVDRYAAEYRAILAARRPADTESPGYPSIGKAI